MAYDRDLGERVRGALGSRKGVTELKMFGGLCFTMGGNMAVGVYQDDLIVRFDPAEDLASESHTKPFDITGRAMRGWLMVEPAGTASDADLARWVAEGADYASSLPPKTEKKRKPRART